jgi:acyl-CoA reductase-like NAD-dependent aldehyde dehydrogenase
MRQLHIDGEWIDSESDVGTDMLSPVDSEVVDTIPDASGADGQKAVPAAERARPQLEAMTPVQSAVTNEQDY